MSKDDIIKTLAAKMEKIWIPIQIGKETDIVVDCDLFLNEMGFPRLPLRYKASVLLDETKKTMLFWDSLWEQKKSFSNGRESIELVPSKFLNVWLTKRNPDGTSDLFASDIPSIRYAFQAIAKSYGWKFKKIEKREDTQHPEGYSPRQAEKTDDQTGNGRKAPAALAVWVTLIILFIFFIILFLPLLNTFSWSEWSAIILLFIGLYFLQNYIYRYKGFLLFVFIWFICAILMLFTFASLTG
ncbi:MAG: hypothetical protein A4E56_03358 [Pelotomaculum sp. PtaU1.Bin065]|nr:MAG: hypothetical protein A4E56_03358 [Pelotomaculum sp. PtaU1.Bin065]